jgi:predicted RNase H-like HicB family nuclease
MMEEYTLRLSIELLSEGQFLATSSVLPALVAQGRTVAETLEIARDVARKLLDSYREHGDEIPSGLHRVADKIEVDVAVGV